MEKAADAMQIVKLSYRNLNQIAAGNHNITLSEHNFRNVAVV
jgi:hypothetical protein